MPNIDVKCCRLESNALHHLVQRFAKAVENVTGAKDDDVVQRFVEIPRDHFAVGSVLLSEAVNRRLSPTFDITVHWLSGKTDRQRDDLATQLTDAASEIAGVDRSRVEITFKVLDRDGFYSGGQQYKKG